MTCREKLKLEYPEKVRNDSFGGCVGCPSSYGYLPNPAYCTFAGGNNVCKVCWDREIDETNGYWIVHMIDGDTLYFGKRGKYVREYKGLINVSLDEQGDNTIALIPMNNIRWIEHKEGC